MWHLGALLSAALRHWSMIVAGLRRQQVLRREIARHLRATHGTVRVRVLRSCVLRACALALRNLCDAGESWSMLRSSGGEPRRHADAGTSTSSDAQVDTYVRAQNTTSVVLLLLPRTGAGSCSPTHRFHAPAKPSGSGSPVLGSTGTPPVT